MSLINYMEPVNLGSIFVGIGGLILCGTLSYIFYRIYIKFIQYFDVVLNREAKYEILEESFLDVIGKNKGIDLNQELRKRKIFEENKKSFRKKVEEQVYEEMFGKKEDKE